VLSCRALTVVSLADSADKEEKRQRTKEVDLKSSAEFFRFLSLGADIHLPTVLSGSDAAGTYCCAH
jgi:hypothetical protein